MDYLAKFCGGKKPLTLETGRRHSGWKGCLLTERKRKAFHVFWIDNNAGKLFRQLWSLYIKHSRPVQPKTPWAFLTKDGQPMGTLAYIDSFKKAVEKIGLESGKWNGTTPHGLRHRYGQWLNDAKVGEKEGQICMHHTSVASQRVYRQMTPEDVAESIKVAVGGSSIVSLPSWMKDGDDNE
jgi:integrase